LFGSEWRSLFSAGVGTRMAEPNEEEKMSEKRERKEEKVTTKDGKK
jgi:hypothetical protein